jgi:hypothetical protein
MSSGFVVQSDPDSELMRLARYFHQDFGVVHKTFDKGVLSYLSYLTADRISALLHEIATFVDSEAADAELTRRWLALGVHWWPPRMSARVGLGRVVELASKRDPSQT